MGDNIKSHHVSRQEENLPKSYALSGKIMLIAIVILFVVVVFMVSLHLYARWYLLRVRRRYPNRRRSRRRRATHIVFYVDSTNPNSAVLPVANSGLESSVLSSLPVFIYSSKTHPEIADCAVCLSEFEENEKGRILPKCHHSFHTDCIDMWFHSHSTCPICRAPVEAGVHVQPLQDNRSDVVVSIDETAGTVPSCSTSGLVPPCPPEEGGRMSTTSLADRRKGLDLVGVRIEVPSSELMDEMRLSSPSSHGFKSPGTRLQSLKRILSMNRKSMAVSPSSGIGTSCGTEGTEFDIELVRGESIQEQTRAQTPR